MKHTNVAPKRTLLIAFMAVVLAVGLTLPVSLASAVPSSSSKQAEAQAALDKLNDMQATLDAASNNYYEAEEERSAAEAKVQEAEAQIQEETEKIKGYQEELGTRARSMYRTGGNTFLDVILGASTFEEFATNWNMLNTMNENDAELVAKTKESREKVEAAKVEYEQQEQVAAQKASEAKAIKDEAEATTAQMQETYDNLNAEVQELMRQEEEARSAANAAAAQLSGNIALPHLHGLTQRILQHPLNAWREAQMPGHIGGFIDRNDTTDGRHRGLVMHPQALQGLSCQTIFFLE